MDPTRKSFRNADSLPIEWIMQIMSFLNLNQRFVCKSVCKKWKFAAEQSLADQKTVVLAAYDVRRDINGHVIDQSAVLYLNRSDHSEAASSGSSVMDYWNRLKPDQPIIQTHGLQVVRSLSCLKNLLNITCMMGSHNRLHHFRRHQEFEESLIRNYKVLALEKIAKSVILSNSQTLTTLSAQNMDLPQDAQHPVTYPRLTELTCKFLTKEGAFPCPRLKKLTIYCKCSGLQDLPADAMEELNLECSQHYGDNVPLFPILSRLSNLKSLRVNSYREYVPFEEFFSKLVEYYTKLVVLKLPIGRSSNEPDSLIRKLLLTNPQLRELSLSVKRLSSEEIQTLAKFPNLQEIEAEYNGQDPITDMLNLLRGLSRRSLQNIHFSKWYSEDIVDQLPLIESELRLMQQETGFSYNFTPRILSYTVEASRSCKIIRGDHKRLQ